MCALKLLATYIYMKKPLRHGRGGFFAPERGRTVRFLSQKSRKCQNSQLINKK